ncbi:HAD family hydrolase [Simkania negevensis]|nr:HAD family phosphatase [Simkania negevensis]MCB1066782.1 HAD family phosphatase [Simkania sp.]MCB1073988.1 HAD family phosphatase [Simkania sp.]MCP5490782.1 HAD family phosphatase [Chlamydiales bacterium]
MISVSAFDLDHTLVHSNCSLLFYRHLIKKGIFHPLSFLRALIYKSQYELCGMPLQDLHKKVFRRFLQGQPLKRIEDEVQNFLEADFYRYLYMPAYSRLRRAQHEGHHTVIISNSPSFLVRPIANYLEVTEWYSSEYLTDEKGTLKEVGSILLGDGKANYLQKIIRKLKTKREKVTAYSDSMIDLPFLYAAGRAIVVNPSGKMRKISEEKHWEVI